MKCEYAENVDIVGYLMLREDGGPQTHQTPRAISRKSGIHQS